MKTTLAHTLLCFGVAAGVGLCGCKPSQPASAPANQSYVQPSNAPDSAALESSAPSPSGLTITPPSGGAAPAKAHASADIAGAWPHRRWRHHHRHSSTDGERG